MKGEKQKDSKKEKMLVKVTKGGVELSGDVDSYTETFLQYLSLKQLLLEIKLQKERQKN